MAEYRRQLSGQHKVVPATKSEARVVCAPGGDVGASRQARAVSISAGRAGFVFIMIVSNRELLAGLGHDYANRARADRIFAFHQ